MMRTKRGVKKLTPFTDGKKRKMHMTKITAVALTSRGANPEAHVTFFKSADKQDKDVSKGHGDLVDILTSVEDGHQHGITVETYDGSLYINVMYAKSADEEHGHYHAVGSVDGELVIATNAGHAHSLDFSSLTDLLMDSLIKREDTISEDQASTLTKLNLNTDTEDSIMSEKLQKLLDDANAALLLNKTALANAITIGSFTDTTKSYYNGLADADKELFVAKTDADRHAQIEMAKSADPVVFKSAAGIEYKKSAGEAMINMAKQLDEQSTALTAQSALTKNAEFAKRASDDLGNVVGEDAHKIALLRAIDGIEDEDTRKGALAILASANSLGKMVTSERGTLEASETLEQQGESTLGKMVKKYAEDNSVSETEAYEKVLDTSAGQAAYNKDLTNV